MEGVIGGVDEKGRVENGEKEGFRAEVHDFERVGERKRLVAREEAELRGGGGQSRYFVALRR